MTPPDAAVYCVKRWSCSVSKARLLVMKARCLPVRGFLQAGSRWLRGPLVVVQAKSPKRYRKALEEYEASLPPCTPEVLSQWRGEEGRWVDDRWRPYSCHLRRISPG